MSKALLSTGEVWIIGHFYWKTNLWSNRCHIAEIFPNVHFCPDNWAPCCILHKQNVHPRKRGYCTQYSPQNLDMPPTMHDKCWRGTKSSAREEHVCSGEAEGAQPTMLKTSSKFSQRYCLFGWEFGSLCISVKEARKKGGSLFFFLKQHLSPSHAHLPTSNKQRQTASQLHNASAWLDDNNSTLKKNEHQSLPQLHQHYL